MDIEIQDPQAARPIFSLSTLLSPVVQLLHLFTLWGFAIAYPIYEVIVHNQGFLVMYHASFQDITWVFVIFSFGLPLFYYILLGLPTLFFAKLHLELLPFMLSVWSLLSLLTLKYLSTLPFLFEPYTIYVAFGFGFFLTAIYAQKAKAREFVSYLAGAALLFPLIYLMMLKGTPSSTPVTLEAATKKGLQPHPIVVVIFDELSLGSLLNEDQSLLTKEFPSFARLANIATWYRDASTVGEVTMTAVPAIASGLLPISATTLPTYGEHPVNIFTVLKTAGYSVHADEFTTYLCPSSINERSTATLSSANKVMYITADSLVFWAHSVLPKSWHQSLPIITNITPPYFPLFRSSQEQNPAIMVKELGDSLARMTPEQKSLSFFYLHIALPHRPYLYYPSGKKYIDFVQMPEKYGNDIERWNPDSVVRAISEQRYFLQLQYADTILGRILDQLDANKILDQSLIAVIADHGMSFRPGANLRFAVEKDASDFASATLTLDVLKVPFFIKYPFQTQASIIDTPTRTVDLFPTILGTILPQFTYRTDGIVLNKPHTPYKYPMTVLSHHNNQTFSHSLSVFDPQFFLEQKFQDLDWENSFAPKNLCADEKNLIGKTVSKLSPPLNNIKHRNIGSEVSIPSNALSITGLFLGEIERDPTRLLPTRILVVVDSQIAAITVPIMKDKRIFLNALIPEKYLTPGKHTVTIHDASDLGC